MAKESGAEEKDLQEELEQDEVIEDSDMFAEFASKYSKDDREIESSEEEQEEDEQEEEKAADADDGKEKGKKVDGEEETKDGAKDGSNEDLDEQEILKSLDPKARAIFEKAQREAADWRHRFKSDEGRVSALQKKINKLEEATKAPVIAPDDLVKAFKDKDSWKAFAEVNPEIAAPISEFMEGLANSVTSSLQEQRDVAKVIKEKAVKEADREAEDLLGQEHPGWKDLVSTQDFKDWLDVQPVAIREIVADGTVEDSVMVITNFKNYLVASGKTKPEETKETEEERKAREKADKLKSKRSKQLEDGAAPPPKGGSAKPTGDLSTESLFDHFASKKEKR